MPQAGESRAQDSLMSEPERFEGLACMELLGVGSQWRSMGFMGSSCSPPELLPSMGLFSVPIDA